jgi:hypothetical protein
MMICPSQRLDKVCTIPHHDWRFPPRSYDRGMQAKLEGVSVKEAQRKLLTYTALDNRVHLEAFLFLNSQFGAALHYR